MHPSRAGHIYIYMFGREFPGALRTTLHLQLRGCESTNLPVPATCRRPAATSMALPSHQPRERRKEKNRTVSVHSGPRVFKVGRGIPLLWSNSRQPAVPAQAIPPRTGHVGEGGHARAGVRAARGRACRCTRGAAGTGGHKRQCKFTAGTGRAATPSASCRH